MAVSIDSVYQKVLAFANKEQRGYITPQEFNLFANQAQMEIFEQYFYDLNQWDRRHGNKSLHSDMSEILEEKIEMFSHYDTLIPVGTTGVFALPDDLYRIIELRMGNIIVEKVKYQTSVLAAGSYLTTPTTARPTYSQIMGDNHIQTNPTLSNITLIYTKKHKKVEWGYFVINDKALYDGNTSKTTNFELHPSEETELVYKILKLAGVSMKRDDIMRAGQGMEISQVQQEKQ